MALLPADVPTGLITGEFHFVNEDSVDSGTDPDLLPVTGTVTFTASVPQIRFPSKLATLIPLTFDAEFNSSGQLVPKGQTSIGIELPATNSGLLSPLNYTWRVSFNLKEAATNFTINIPSFSFSVPAGSTQDLTTLTPVDTTPGTITIQGPKGDTGTPGNIYGAGHTVMVQRERRSLGGPIGTGGKPVLAIRIDHNNKAFQEIVLPMLRARALPASMCHFVNEFSPDPGYTNDVSTGYSWADVQRAALKDGIEVFSHSWTHTDAVGTEALDKEIRQSRIELESQMPLIRVKGFMVPGVLGTGWGGFTTNLSNLDVYRTTEAGQMVMNNYASSNGGGAQLQPLNSDTTLGWESRAIDTDTTSATEISIIKTAQATGQATVMMLHPSQVDKGAGYVTSTVLAEILDYIVAERDAGRLEVLTVTGLLLADTERTTRNILLRDPKFEAVASFWVGSTGYTFAGGVASGSTAAGMLGQNVNLGTQQGWAQGSTRMLEAEFKATAGAVVRVRAYDLANSANYDVSRDLTLPASPNFVTLRQPLCIPTSGIANLRVEFGRVSGGAIEFKNPALKAI